MADPKLELVRRSWHRGFLVGLLVGALIGSFLGALIYDLAVTTWLT